MDDINFDDDNDALQFDNDDLQLTSEEDLDTNSDTDINSNFFDNSVGDLGSSESSVNFSNDGDDIDYSGKVINTGRWTQKEHELFMEGIRLHNKQWRPIADLIKTRSVVQIRTHAQKYFQKLHKAKGNNVDMNTINNNSVMTLKSVNIKKESKRKLGGNNEITSSINDINSSKKMNRNNDYDSSENLLSLSPTTCPESSKDSGEESPSPKGVVELLEQIENHDEEQKKWAEMNTFSWKLPEHDIGQSTLIDIMNNGKGGFIGNTELFHTEQSDFSSVCDVFFEKDELLLLLEDHENDIDIAQIAEGL